jgi:putative transposase
MWISCGAFKEFKPYAPSIFLVEGVIKIYRTIKLKISCSNYDLKRIEQCNKESADIWNRCISMNKELYEKEKKSYGKYELYEIAKTFHTNIICAVSKRKVIDKLVEAYKAIFYARKAGRYDEIYPHKIKNFYPTEWDYQSLSVNYEDNSINLTTIRIIDENGNKRNNKQIKLCFKTKIPDNIKSLKLICKNNSYYAYISYEIEDINKININTNFAAIDLGEIHSITSIDLYNNQLIITGRKLREIKQLRNKKYKELKNKMSKCTINSNQWKKYQKALIYIGNKARNQIQYCLHKLTKLYVNWAIEKGISVVYIGDVTGIEQNTKKEHKLNRVSRQKISQWDYGKIINLLQYKLNLEGIIVKLVGEQYSSRICPNCKTHNKVNNRNYKCKACGNKFHRDIVGAWNILRFNKGDILQLPVGNIKYLRIV